jgi:SAM-dependent methyltransferase
MGVQEIAVAAPGANPSYEGAAELEAMREAHRYNADLVERIDLALGCSIDIADFGAGIGTFAGALQARGLHRVLCVEPDPALRNRAVELHGHAMRWLASSKFIASNSLDGAYSLNVLEHIAPEQELPTLKEWVRTLRAGGLIFLYVPAFPALYSEMDRRVGHFRRYTRAHLLDLMNEAGLDVESWGYADSIGFLASLWLRARGSAGSINPAMVRFYDRQIYPVSRLIDRFFAYRMPGKNIWAVGRKRD